MVGITIAIRLSKGHSQPSPHILNQLNIWDNIQKGFDRSQVSSMGFDSEDVGL
jgi:hypothetical protein